MLQADIVSFHLKREKTSPFENSLMHACKSKRPSIIPSYYV